MLTPLFVTNSIFEMSFIVIKIRQYFNFNGGSRKIRLDFKEALYLLIDKGRHFQSIVDDNFLASASSVGKMSGVADFSTTTWRKVLERTKLIVACQILFPDSMVLIMLIQVLCYFDMYFESTEAN